MTKYNNTKGEKGLKGDEEERNAVRIQCEEAVKCNIEGPRKFCVWNSINSDRCRHSTRV